MNIFSCLGKDTIDVDDDDDHHRRKQKQIFLQYFNSILVPCNKFTIFFARFLLNVLRRH